MSHNIIPLCHMLYHIHIWYDKEYDIIYDIIFDLICNIIYDVTAVAESVLFECLSDSPPD